MIEPLTRSSAEDAERHGLAWASWPADLTTPVAVVSALRRAGRHVCLLESVEGPERLARYSFVGVDPVARFRAGGEGTTLTTGSGSETLDGQPRDALRAVSARLFADPPGRPAGPPNGPPNGQPAGLRAGLHNGQPAGLHTGLPAELPPFRGGWVGWFAYEWASRLEPRVPRPASDPWQAPDVSLDLYRDVLAFDHAAQRLFIMCHHAGGRAGSGLTADERIDAIAADALAAPGPGLAFGLTGPWKSNVTDDDYRAGVTRLRAEIGQGEIFQAVLSRRFEAPCEGDPLTLYRALRLANPSPHMFFFEADGVTLVGSSPERLLSVNGRRAQVHPIAGTRPRGKDGEDDERLGAELRADVKERAEHDMLVDLARNDLGRVARVGTVELKEYQVLERFARVQHLVSRVEADLATGIDALDALAACFPAGTVSGAPKIRAMELLAELEPDTRGPYAGAFGYLDAAGNLDMALVIRTFAVRDGRLSVQAGAGIVFDSDPAKEEAETRHKAAALFDAVTQASSPAFTGGLAAPSLAAVPAPSPAPAETDTELTS